MEIGLILKVAGVGFLVAVACQVLKSTGKEDHSMFVSLAGIVIVLLMLTKEIGNLITTISSVFGI
ncbi:MAG: stage III sporulation protein AC [Ruminococcaceae bacterium]|nr:stage III sporulation protein AC [Oscillospiraceae bacterium]